ncbi:hypothetical protein [Streptomyces sp. NRRL F-2664]|uniref:hypothetical protein n=1 Tax=Streptomyces sp. NRRL F-2664 TaxID=1463842 RepID=UPI0018FE2A34|nr:hypothetical protein [Streptomyces sp. NRRL F-2664]
MPAKKKTAAEKTSSDGGGVGGGDEQAEHPGDRGGGLAGAALWGALELGLVALEDKAGAGEARRGDADGLVGVNGCGGGTGWASARMGGPSLLMLRSGSDHGCHEVTEPLPSGADREDGRLSWACLFTIGLTA